MMRTLAIIPLTLMAVACTAKYQVQDLSGDRSVRLDPQIGVLVVVPRDGAYESTQYPGSGQTVAGAVAAAFSRHAAQVQISEGALTSQDAISSAKTKNLGYVVVPLITHWEQRATEWSGRPSKMTIRVTVIDASSEKELISTSVEGRSRIMSMTSTSPESLLRDPLAQYVARLY